MKKTLDRNTLKVFPFIKLKVFPFIKSSYLHGYVCVCVCMCVITHTVAKKSTFFSDPVLTFNKGSHVLRIADCITHERAGRNTKPSL